MKTVRGVKIKTLHMNVPLRDSKLCSWVVPVVHVCVRWWSRASCQRHRDTTLIRTHGALVHHKQALLGP